MSNCLNDWFVDGADSRCRCRREVQRFYYNLVVRSQQADAARLGRENLKAASTKMAPVLTATGVLAATADFHHLGFFSFLAVFATVLTVLFWRTITCWVRAFAGIIVSHRSDLLKVSVGWIYSDGGGFTIMLGAVTRGVKCGDSRILRVIHGRDARPLLHFSKPDNQCMILSATCRLSMPERFMPKGILFGPANCADSIAASPRTTTRPLPKVMTMP